MATQTQQKTILDNPTVLERAIIYARVSTDEQAESGTSIDNQIEKSLAYAAACNMNVVAIFKEDYTGKVLDRPELNKARDILRTGLADNLIVYKTNRLDRSEWGINLLLLLQEFKQLGVELHYSQSGRRVDLSNPVEALMQSIEGWQSGEDHREVTRRLIEGRYSRAKAGYIVPHGVTLYGYNKVKKDKKWYLEINEAEATVVRLMFQWYVYGDETGKKLSMLAIAERLAEMGIGTRSGRRWWRASIRGVLLNESYAGIWYYGRSSENPIAVEIPAIVDRETWKAAQERVVFNTGFAVRNRKPGRYLMSGRVKCGDCGYKMTGQTTQSEYGYYRCPTNLDSEHGNECNLPGFKSAIVDTNVWATLEKIVSDKNRLLDGLRGYQSQQESKVEPIRRELTYVEQLIKDKTAEWEDDYASIRFLPELAKAKKGIEMAQTEQVLKELEAKKAGLLAQLEKESLTEQQINNIVRFAYQVYRDMKALRQAEREGNATPELRLKVFEAKRKLLELLDVQITLTILNGQRKGVMTAKFCAEGESFMVELNNFYKHKLNHKNWITITEVINLD